MEASEYLALQSPYQEKVPPLFIDRKLGGPRAVLVAAETRGTSFLCRESNADSLVVYNKPSRCTK
jgi:hypothetical protein